MITYIKDPVQAQNIWN